MKIFNRPWMYEQRKKKKKKKQQPPFSEVGSRMRRRMMKMRMRKRKTRVGRRHLLDPRRVEDHVLGKVSWVSALLSASNSSIRLQTTDMEAR